MNVNSGAGTNNNAVNNTDGFAEILVAGFTIASTIFGYRVSAAHVGDNYLLRAGYAGVCGTSVYLFAQSVHHGVATLWNASVAITDAVSTVMTNHLTPFSEDSSIVKASTYAGAYLGLMHGPFPYRPACNLVNPSAPPVACSGNIAHMAERLVALPSSTMVGAGVGYLLGKGLDFTAKAAVSGAKMAADRLGLKTTVSQSPEVATDSSGRIRRQSESAEEILQSGSAEMVRQRSPDGTETEAHLQEAGQE
ncbi:hypothetical protein [Endozoicomonas sp. ONNA2]|uniref:hypothetical protein n=1 Tax=Endozoicomonas sp. ONNA2 TaxID=2828741 RepID=UPI0021498B62|nr:hypothetical protein [Endozoicomonas sp. ONNA2]